MVCRSTAFPGDPLRGQRPAVPVSAGFSEQQHFDIGLEVQYRPWSALPKQGGRAFGARSQRTAGLGYPRSSSIEQNRQVDQPTQVSLFATEEDASAIAGLRSATAAHLTRTFGQGHWSRIVTERAVRSDLKTARVLVARRGPSIVGTMTLATKKPWAIELAYFTAVPRALYLREMAVAPALQRQGVGRELVRDAITVARAWPSQAIRLDAYDAPARAGGFYATCGFREVGRVTYRQVPLIYFELLF